MTLQQLLVLEALVALVTDKAAAIVVLRLAVVQHRARVVQLLATQVARVTLLFDGSLFNTQYNSLFSQNLIGFSFK